MDDITLAYAKDHLEELIARARRGEDVRIAAPDGVVRLAAVAAGETNDAARKPRRITDEMPPFVPLKEPRVPGRWKDRLPDPPIDFFEPMSEEELKDWYGDTR